MAADPNKLKIVKELGRKDMLFGMARVPGTSRLFCGSSDAKVYDLDILAEKPEPKEMAGHEGYVTGVAQAGAQVVTGAYDGRLIWWNAETHEQVRSVAAHPRAIRGVSATPDGKLVASVADDMVCRLWDAESGKLVHELRGHNEKTPNHYPSMLYASAISSDGKLLATGDKTGHVVIWDIATGKSLARLEAPEHYTWDPKARRHSIGGIRSLAFSPDSVQLAVGGMGKVGNIDHLEGKALVHVFDWQKGERLHEFASEKFKGLVEQLRFHHAGDWLVAAGGAHDGFLWFLDVKTKQTITQDKAPMHINTLVLNETSDSIYAVGHGKIVVWELKG